jgi:hypothetical protein
MSATKAMTLPGTRYCNVPVSNRLTGFTYWPPVGRGLPVNIFSAWGNAVIDADVVLRVGPPVNPSGEPRRQIVVAPTPSLASSPIIEVCGVG